MIPTLLIITWIIISIFNNRMLTKYEDNTDTLKNFIFWFILGPLTFLYVISTYGHKIFQREYKHNGIYTWWDMVECNWMEAMYCWLRAESYKPVAIIMKWESDITICNIDEIKPIIKSSYMQEELEIFAQAEKLRKESESLLKKVQNKRTIFSK